MNLSASANPDAFGAPASGGALLAMSNQASDRGIGDIGSSVHNGLENELGTDRYRHYIWAKLGNSRAPFRYYHVTLS